MLASFVIVSKEDFRFPTTEDQPLSFKRSKWMPIVEEASTLGLGAWFVSDRSVHQLRNPALRSGFCPVLINVGEEESEYLPVVSAKLKKSLVLRGSVPKVLGLLREKRYELTIMPEYDKLPTQCQQAFAWALRNLDVEHLTNEALAKQAYRSERSLHRDCVASTGLPPHKLLLRMRVFYAVRLLQDSEIPLEEISFAVGIESNHFRDVLKRELGNEEVQKIWDGRK